MASVWFFVVQLALLLLVSGFKVRLRDGMGMVISLAISMQDPVRGQGNGGAVAAGHAGSRNQCQG